MEGSKKYCIRPVKREVIKKTSGRDVTRFVIPETFLQLLKLFKKNIKNMLHIIKQKGIFTTAYQA